MFEGLLGALIGAVVAAAATILVAKWQLKLVADNHREALEEQNKLLKETFAQHLLLQANDKRIQHQLEFLNRLERVVVEDAWNNYLKGNTLRNAGPEGLDGQKALELAVEIRAFQADFSDLTIKFDRLVAENAHLQQFYSDFRPSLNFQSKFYDAVARLVLTLEEYPVNPAGELVGSIREKFQNFSLAVDDCEKWMQSCREKFQSYRTQIYAGEIIE